MTEVHENTGPPNPEQPQETPGPEQRVRKRRRRTMACTQCRSRKLRCDREYPACSRCLKSKTPTKCTYEDGFLWQQPNTVASPVFSDRGSTTLAQNQIPRVDRAPALTTPDSGISRLSARPQPPLPPPPPPLPPSGSVTSHPLARHGEEKRTFLETVLGAPRAGINQEPYADTEVLQRPQHGSEHRHEVQPQLHALENDDGLASPAQQLDILPRMMMRGKETMTRFNGSGILANVIAQFPDIRSFAEEVRLSSPNLSQLRPDLERVKRGLWKRKPLSEPLPVPDTRVLIGILPARRAVDELVVLYLNCIEATHRILHVPSFLKELDEFWAQKDNPEVVSASFVVQLLLVLACAWNLADFDTLQLKNETGLKCYTPVEWVLHAEKWLDNAHIKRPEITALRMKVLLIIAQNSFGMKRSHAWLATGTLVKQAMIAGYHRDPSRYTMISVFNKEMRRRIWTTIVELDLQVALERGMPPSVQDSDYDTVPALNINDNEIDEDSTVLPAGRPLHEVTDSSFQAVLTQSLPIRLKACALMHSPRIRCRYEEILHLDWDLERYLARIPAWSVSPTDDFHTQHKVILMRSLLETKIGHSLLSIHTPFAIEAPREPLFAPSARSRLEIATMILSNQKRLHETSKQLSLCNLGDWTMQAFCSVCQILHAGDDRHASTPMILTRTLPGLSESLISLLDMILAAVETRLLLVIKGAKEYFFMSTLLALVRAKLWPAQANVYKQEVVDRVIYFAQTLFTRHANCSHLGAQGLGCFKTDQVPSLDMADFSGLLQPESFEITPPGDIDPFLEVFDWADLTGITFSE
ncbi:putative C6 transcription factor [Aspergillus clavatus NRRL 1]|uniref:C6 transcription factor, putative n=1 Tax=Aspergillus clavatus (strain ATCC 1007 / CBS 513.65 / DSM 816 / NCTC 3887 / NRRL 1 / QM 1276 / 107) TaxID=344612 RepID=A1CK28_ASPCL|nr:C6 transcription factor, putative [Aspergillus clavatus NRRL 1]EAW09502.1 C6 transcription factor, putative [Aspergillus clavatus NRRL 1]